MKNILVIGKFYTEGFGLHIAGTLSAMGYTVSRFEPGIQSGRMGGRLGHRIDKVRSVLHSSSDSIPAIRARRARALWRAVERSAPELVIVCHDFLWPEEVEQLKQRAGARVVLWFPDALVNFGRGYFMNAAYDALFFKDPYIIHALGDVLESPVYYLPECFNPSAHALPAGGALPDPIYDCDIGTAGNLHAWRVACYKHLAHYEVKIWGHPAPLWMNPGVVSKMHQHRGVFNQEKAQAFRGARIVVNNLHYGEVWGVNARCFEAAGVGAFQMVNWRPGLDHLFVPGRELVTFDSMADLVEKVDYWLPREEERREIAEAGMRRAQSEHTYRQRLELLLSTVAGQARGMAPPDIGYRS